MKSQLLALIPILGLLTRATPVPQALTDTGEIAYLFPLSRQSIPPAENFLRLKVTDSKGRAFVTDVRYQFGVNQTPQFAYTKIGTPVVAKHIEIIDTGNPETLERDCKVFNKDGRAFTRINKLGRQTPIFWHATAMPISPPSPISGVACMIPPIAQSIKQTFSP